MTEVSIIVPPDDWIDDDGNILEEHRDQFEELKKTMKDKDQERIELLNRIQWIMSRPMSNENDLMKLKMDCEEFEEKYGETISPGQ